MKKENMKGIVEKAGAYPLKEPETYQFQGKNITNTHRLALKLQGDDVWFSFGNSSSDGFYVKDDDGKSVILGAGSEVQIAYQQNGKYRNAKKAGLLVLDLVQGEKFNAEKSNEGGSDGGSTVRSPSGGGNPSSSGSFVNPAEVGQCLNLAVEVLGLDQHALLDDTEVRNAIAWYKEVREKFQDVYPDVKAGVYTDSEDSNSTDVPFDDDEDV